MDVSQLKSVGRFHTYWATDGDKIQTVSLFALPITNKGEWDSICGSKGRMPKRAGKYGWMLVLNPTGGNPRTTYVSTATSLNTDRLREGFGTVMSHKDLALVTEIISHVTKLACNVPTAELGYA